MVRFANCSSEDPQVVGAPFFFVLPDFVSSLWNKNLPSPVAELKNCETQRILSRLSSGRLNLLPGQTLVGAFQHPLSPGIVLAKHFPPGLAFIST